MSLERDETGKLQAIAWPGGYSVLYLCEDGETVCADCANEADVDSDVWQGDRPTTAYIHWEGDADNCARCNKALPSEYGPID